MKQIKSCSNSLTKPRRNTYCRPTAIPDKTADKTEPKTDNNRSVADKKAQHFRGMSEEREKDNGEQKQEKGEKGAKQKGKATEERGKGTQEILKSNIKLCRSKGELPRRGNKKKFFSDGAHKNKFKEWKANVRATFPENKDSPASTSIHVYPIDSIISADPSLQFTTLNLAFSNIPLSESSLSRVDRVNLIDWLAGLSVSIGLKRESVHLAMSYVDMYIEVVKTVDLKLLTLGGGSLLLAVKQEERQFQDELMIRLLEEGLKREEVIELECSIIVKLKFKLNFNTMAFWGDYFSTKWDNFLGIAKKSSNQTTTTPSNQQLCMRLRDWNGMGYKHYRELSELMDVVLMDVRHRQHENAKLALACIYLVVRVEREISNHSSCECPEQLLKISREVWLEQYRGFQKKASPIFKDKWRLNEVFNEFATQVCNFELTEIIPSIKYVATWIDMPFSYVVSSSAYERVNSYENFLRLMTHSPKLREFALRRIA